MKLQTKPRPVGRPPGSVTAAEDQTRPRSVRLNDARWDKYRALGSAWLARKIDAEPWPTAEK